MWSEDEYVRDSLLSAIALGTKKVIENQVMNVHAREETLSEIQNAKKVYFDGQKEILRLNDPLDPRYAKWLQKFDIARAKLIFHLFEVGLISVTEQQFMLVRDNEQLKKTIKSKCKSTVKKLTKPKHKKHKKIKCPDRHAIRTRMLKESTLNRD